ncbi:MAG: MaoC family dehydratase [Bacillota bacterium]
MASVPFESIRVGDQASFSKTVGETDIYLYAGITGDFNGVHLNSQYAAGSVFGERVAHGMLSAGFISTVLGTRLPGEGSVYLSQTLKFTAPVKIGDTITATVEVLEKIEAKRRVRLSTVCVNQRGQRVIEGEALVMCP